MAYAVFKRYNQYHIHIGVPLLQKVFNSKVDAEDYKEGESLVDRKQPFIWIEEVEYVG